MKHDWLVLSIAYHEAAHAVAALVQGIPFKDCTLASDRLAGRVNIANFYPEGADPEILRRYAIMYLAGWEAQLHHTPDLNAELFGPSIDDDLRTARRCVGNAVSGEEERLAILNEWLAETRALVSENWAAIESVGAAVADRGNLTAEEVAELFSAGLDK